MRFSFSIASTQYVFADVPAEFLSQILHGPASDRFFGEVLYFFCEKGFFVFDITQWTSSAQTHHITLLNLSIQGFKLIVIL
jgi:hypothetical protein